MPIFAIAKEDNPMIWQEKIGESYAAEGDLFFISQGTKTQDLLNSSLNGCLAFGRSYRSIDADAPKRTTMPISDWLIFHSANPCFEWFAAYLADAVNRVVALVPIMLTFGFGLDSLVVLDDAFGMIRLVVVFMAIARSILAWANHIVAVGMFAFDSSMDQFARLVVAFVTQAATPIRRCAALLTLASAVWAIFGSILALEGLAAAWTYYAHPYSTKGDPLRLAALLSRQHPRAFGGHKRRRPNGLRCLDNAMIVQMDGMRKSQRLADMGLEPRLI